MSQLTKLIDAAAGSESVSNVVRQLWILARRTGATELSAWAEKELNGYDTAEEVPAYRGPLPIYPLGLFVDRFGQKLTGISLPSVYVPAEHREKFYNMWLLQPLATLETWAQQDTVRLGWEPNLVEMFNAMVDDRQAGQIPNRHFKLRMSEYHLQRAQTKGILDGIRHKALDLALALEESVPEAGEPNASAETKQKAVTVINQHFDFSGATLSGSNYAFGSSDVDQSVTITQGNDSQLHAALGSAGVATADVERLFEALEKNGGSVEDARSWFDSIKESIPAQALVLVGGLLGAFFGVPAFAA